MRIQTKEAWKPMIYQCAWLSIGKMSELYDVFTVTQKPQKFEFFICKMKMGSDYLPNSNVFILNFKAKI